MTTRSNSGKPRKKIGIILLSLGLLALISAASLYAYNVIEESNAAKSSEYAVEILLEKIEENLAHSQSLNSPINAIDSPSDETIAELDTTAPASIEIEGQTYIGVLSIPSLQLKWPVNTEWSYPKLRLSPCRYSGSAEENNLAISAHNYRYQFGELTRLKVGDRIVYTDIQGEKYQYYVEQIETIQPTSIYKVVNSSYDLNLFTCNYSGDARILVKCNLIKT